MNYFLPNISPLPNSSSNQILVAANSKGTSIDPGAILKPFMNPQGIAMLGLMVFLILVSNMNQPKGQITTGKTAGTGELLFATSLALKQIKERKLNKVTFWCGTPRYWWKGNHLQGKLKNSVALGQTLIGNSPSVWIPHAERSTLVLGAPGGGKTFGTIDRMAESCLQQGFPMIVYARKEDEMQFIAPLAARYGYDVRIFAPGESYSEVINPLDFMRDAEDQETAGQIASVINDNARGGNRNGGDPFFEQAANLLAKGLIQLAKSSECPDLATVYCLQSVPNFLGTLETAIQEKRIPRWIAATFLQYRQAADSEKTIASINTTTAGIFSGFIQKSLLPSFMGKTTVPIKLQGKQIIIFKLDDARRDVVGPLLAAALYLIIVSNFSTPRSDPLGIFIDELPSIYLEALPRWINELRSLGACFVLGVQNIKQLMDAYGENRARAIIGACSTKILYNPADLATAEEYSKIYGNKEVKIKNRSVSRLKEGQNITFSESLSTVPILTPDEIMRFPQGKCAITNPGYSSDGEGSIPYILRIPVPSGDVKRISECHHLWESQLKERLVARSPQCRDTQKLDQALEKRENVALRLLGEENLPEIEIVTPPAIEVNQNY